MTTLDSPLVSAEWLHDHITDPQVRVVDVRWYLTEPARGRVEYQESHIPGAAFVDLETELSSPRGQGPGRHPLPTPEAFRAVMERAGISNDTVVIAYDSSGGSAAARLWWLLRYFGHSQVALLNGGWQAWNAAGYPTTAEVPSFAAAQFTPTPQPDMLVDADAVERLRNTPGTLLLDARATERYEGRIEPIDPKAGHIPGARSAPFAGNLNADGTLKSANELRERYNALGAAQAEQIVCYCGSGVTAAHDVLALYLAGYSDAKLYEGSWSDWSSDPSRPVATGEDTGA
jgi:thiosulfate/3-mercaptopyruvate sulfurtransferase